MLAPRSGIVYWTLKLGLRRLSVLAESPIAVIILNWNRRDDTLRCIHSLVASNDIPLDVIVVDNASTDDSVQAIESAFPHVLIIRNERNLGFAEGNNVALRDVTAKNYEYVLLLNNDAVVAPDTITRMIAVIRNRPDVAIVGPSICYLKTPDIVWSAGGQIDWQTGDVTSTHYGRPISTLRADPFEVDHLSGCCMLIRVAAIRVAGLLDPRFFMYYEESEWCARFSRYGYSLMICPSARAWHDISPRAQEGSPAIAYYMTRNHLLFLKATRAPFGAWSHTVVAQCRTVVSLFIRPHSPERARGRIPMLRAMRDFALGRYGQARARG